MKRLDSKLFDEILSLAEASPRRRMHYDLRTAAEEEGWEDMSQRMLNVMMADTKAGFRSYSAAYFSIRSR